MMKQADVFACVSLLVGLGIQSTKPLSSQEIQEWSVEPEPVVEFGVIDGDPNYMFSSVQNSRFLPDGRIAVADRGESTIRIYGSEGEFQAEMGNEGEGPGEFRAIFALWVVEPDTVRVWDPPLLRITAFLADGSLVETVDVNANAAESPGGTLDVFGGAFSNGDIALAWTVGQRLDSEGVSADRTVFGRFNHDGELDLLLGEGEGLHRLGGSPVPFTPYPHAEIFRDSLYFMNGVGAQIAVFDPKGSGVARTIEVPVAPIEVSEAWEVLREKMESSESTDRYRVPEPRLTRTPALAGFLIDGAGFLWVKAYDPASDPIYVGGTPWGAGGEWWVVTPAGDVVAKVHVPNDLVLMDIAEDRLLGLRRGPLDVERIAVHKLRR